MPHVLVSVPGLQIPAAQQPWQFCGLHEIVQTLLMSHAYPGPQSTQSWPSEPQCFSSNGPVQHVPSGMQHPLQFVQLQNEPPRHVPVEQSPPHVAHCCPPGPPSKPPAQKSSLSPGMH